MSLDPPWAVLAPGDPARLEQRVLAALELEEDERDRVKFEIVRGSGRYHAIIGTPADDIMLAPPGTVLKTSSGKIRRAATKERYLADVSPVERAAIEDFRWESVDRRSGKPILPDLKSFTFALERVGMAAADVVPGGTLDNLEHVSPFVDWAPGLSRVDRLLLADAQTSGGLLIALAPDAAEKLVRRLHAKGVQDAAVIGSVIPAGAKKIARAG